MTCIGRRGWPLFLAVLLGACRPAASTLDLRVWIDRQDLAGFSAVVIKLDWAGANRGHSKLTGWHKLPLAAAELTLPDTQPVPAATGRLSDGHYDHVFVAASSVRGIYADGRSVELDNHIEPITVHFDTQANAATTIDIRLIVMPRAPQRGGFDIFTRSAAQPPG